MPEPSNSEDRSQSNRTAGASVWLPSNGTAGYGLFFLVVLVVAYILSARVGDPLVFREDAWAAVGDVLAPLVLMAAFLERTVEVVLTPWRGDEADLIRKRLASARNAGDSARADTEARKLREHRNGTRRRAFMLTVVLGVVAALLGFRALANLVAEVPAGRPFVLFDVLISGFLLAGGAEGIHKPFKAFTDYMEMVSESANRKAEGPPTPQPGNSP